MLSYSFYENDNRVRRYAEALAERGDDVDSFNLRKPGQERNTQINGVQVYRIQHRVRDEQSQISYLLKILAFFFRSMLILTYRHLKSPYKIIHVHNIPDFMIFAAWVPKLFGAKLILDIHDILPELFASKFNKQEDSRFFKVLLWIEKASTAFADHVIIANHLWYLTITKRSVPESKCTPIINYPDPRIMYRRSPVKKNGKFIISYPGTLNWHQGVDIAIEAVAAIKDQIPNIEFHIYGDGPNRKELELLTQKLNVNDQVKFKGFVSMEEIAQALSEVDLGIVPKRKNSFGNKAFSTKILEFMALGVPVLAADTDIDQYYFSENEVVFFPSESKSELARAIAGIKLNSDVREKLVKNGLLYVSHNNWTVKKHEYYQLIAKLVTKKKHERQSNR